MLQYSGMEKSSATSKPALASTARSVGEPSVTPEAQPASQSAFAGAAIGMGWQLAVVVLIPIIGGYKLDQMTGTTAPWLTLTGLVVALAGSILVIRHALMLMNNFNIPKERQ